MYDIYEHRHRVAVWGAGRAYSRRGPGHTIAVAKHLIEKSGLGLINTPAQLPNPDKMDQFVHERIEAVIAVAKPVQYTKSKKGEPQSIEALECTYGRAQKLVNMYLKLKVVCAGHHEDPKVDSLHPPIDSVLLKALFTSKEIDREEDHIRFQLQLKNARKMGRVWTNFDRKTYDAYILAIRTFQGAQPLWAIERLWHPEREALPI